MVGGVSEIVHGVEQGLRSRSERDGEAGERQGNEEKEGERKRGIPWGGGRQRCNDTHETTSQVHNTATPSEPPLDVQGAGWGPARSI